MTAKLIDCLNELRLPAVRDSYQQQADHASREDCTYEQYLAGLMEHEVTARRHKRIARMLRRTIAAAGEETRYLRTRTPCTSAAAPRRDNVLVFGNPGSGKTPPDRCQSVHRIWRSRPPQRKALTGLYVQPLRTLVILSMFTTTSCWLAWTGDWYRSQSVARQSTLTPTSLTAGQYSTTSSLMSTTLCHSAGALNRNSRVFPSGRSRNLPSWSYSRPISSRSCLARSGSYSAKRAFRQSPISPLTRGFSPHSPATALVTAATATRSPSC